MGQTRTRDRGAAVEPYRCSWRRDSGTRDPTWGTKRVPVRALARIPAGVSRRFQRGSRVPPLRTGPVIQPAGGRNSPLSAGGRQADKNGGPVGLASRPVPARLDRITADCLSPPVTQASPVRAREQPTTNVCYDQNTLNNTIIEKMYSTKCEGNYTDWLQTKETDQLWHTTFDQTVI